MQIARRGPLPATPPAATPPSPPPRGFRTNTIGLHHNRARRRHATSTSTNNPPFRARRATLCATRTPEYAYNSRSSALLGKAHCGDRDVAIIHYYGIGRYLTTLWARQLHAAMTSTSYTILVLRSYIDIEWSADWDEVRFPGIQTTKPLDTPRQCRTTVYVVMFCRYTPGVVYGRECGERDALCSRRRVAAKGEGLFLLRVRIPKIDPKSAGGFAAKVNFCVLKFQAASVQTD